MKIVGMIAELIVALLAVLGLYVLIRWICGKLCGPRNVIIVIEILTQREAESAEELIRDALSQYLSLPWVRWAVLTRSELLEHPRLRQALETYGLTCYVTYESD